MSEPSAHTQACIGLVGEMAANLRHLFEKSMADQPVDGELRQAAELRERAFKLAPGHVLEALERARPHHEPSLAATRAVLAKLQAS